MIKIENSNGEFLSLNGIQVTDNNGDITFSVDNDGKVYIRDLEKEIQEMPDKTINIICDRLENVTSYSEDSEDSEDSENN